MKIQVDEELAKIFKEILSFNRNSDEWALIESDDMFQSEKYEVGYDATEEAFCFSYYDQSRKEYWFQMNFDELNKIMTRDIKDIVVRSANN